MREGTGMFGNKVPRVFSIELIGMTLVKCPGFLE